MVTPGKLARIACASLIGSDVTATQSLPHNGTPGNSPVLRVRLACGPSVVVKLYHDHRQWRAVRHTEAITAVGAHTTVPTADVVACGALPGIDVTAMITTDLGPDDLQSAVHKGAYSRGHALAAMGRLLSDLHRMPFDALSPRCGRGPRVDAADLVARRGVVDATLTSVLARAAEAAQPAAGRVWCHGDLHPGNVMVNRTHRRLAVVDLEDMVHAAPEYDLAQCLVTSDALGLGDRAAMLAGYGRSSSSTVLDDLIIYQAVRGLVHAAGSEHRDQRLWQERVGRALRHYLRP